MGHFMKGAHCFLAYYWLFLRLRYTVLCFTQQNYCMYSIHQNCKEPDKKINTVFFSHQDRHIYGIAAYSIYKDQHEQLLNYICLEWTAYLTIIYTLQKFGDFNKRRWEAEVYQRSNF